MIIIVPYQPTWPDEFRAIAVNLRQALGDDALRIDHIGSTSISGLPAKDIIDVQVSVAGLDPAILQALARAGYQHVERITGDHLPPGSPGEPGDWAKWFFRQPAGQRPTNLHVRVLGKPNQRYPLLFRDYLRAHSAMAQAYAQIKFALAKLHPNDIEAYYDVKDPVCDLIMGGADEWAAATHWALGPSDC
jgi:GrpB-like predicted nucleotidyltransferase (UPF0157 family)